MIELIYNCTQLLLSFVEFHFKCNLCFLFINFFNLILCFRNNVLKKLFWVNVFNVYIYVVPACAHEHLFPCAAKRKCCPNYSKLPVDAQTSLHLSQWIIFTSLSTATTSPSLCLSRRVFTLFTTAELLFITFHYASEGDSQLFTTNQHTQTNTWCTQTLIHISILSIHLEPCQDLSYKLHSWSENDF